MSSELENGEVNLKVFLKLLLLISLLTLFFHFFPHLTPSFLRPVATNSYAILTNNSSLQGILIALLLALAIGDVRRFSPLIRLFKWMLFISIVWTAIRWIRGENATAGTTYLAQLISYTAVLAAIWILFRLAGKARYKL